MQNMWQQEFPFAEKFNSMTCQNNCQIIVLWKKVTHFDSPSKVWIFGGRLVEVRSANRLPLKELVMIKVTSM